MVASSHSADPPRHPPPREVRPTSAADFCAAFGGGYCWGCVDDGRLPDDGCIHEIAGTVVEVGGGEPATCTKHAPPPPAATGWMIEQHEIQARCFGCIPAPAPHPRPLSTAPGRDSCCASREPSGTGDAAAAGGVFTAAGTTATVVGAREWLLSMERDSSSSTSSPGTSSCSGDDDAAGDLPAAPPRSRTLLRIRTLKVARRWNLSFADAMELIDVFEAQQSGGGAAGADGPPPGPPGAFLAPRRSRQRAAHGLPHLRSAAPAKRSGSYIEATRGVCGTAGGGAVQCSG